MICGLWLAGKTWVMMMMIRGLLLSLTLFITACTPVYRHHGYVPPDQDLAAIVVGETTQFDVESLVGRPTAKGLLQGSGWYYVGSRWRDFGALPPKEISREVVAVSFAPDGTVSNVERFGLEQGRVVTLSQRVTDSNVVSVGFIRQILGNIGNFSAGQVFD